MEQLPLSTDLIVADYKESSRSALKRVTAKELAHWLRLTSDGVGNQYRLWDKRNHPCAVGGFLLNHFDQQHATEVAALSGRELLARRTAEPVDALRELEARAAKGFVSAEEVRAVLAKTRMEQVDPIRVVRP